MNCDNHICQYDLFSIIRHTNSQLFVKYLNMDVRDMRRVMQLKERAEKVITDKKSPFDAETGKIKDLTEWLN